MTTFADLPSVILMSIAKSQRPVNERVSGWKHTLCSLSICHSWRAAMLPVIYATVFIAIPKEAWGSYRYTPWRWPSNYRLPYNNAGLIYKNGYGFLVKRIIIRTHSACHTQFHWLFMADALGINEKECPGIEGVREWIEVDTDAGYRVPPENNAWTNVFRLFARVFALRFPNARSLGIKTIGNSSDEQIEVLSKIVRVYAHQLVKIDLNNFNVIPEFLKATIIRNFNNTMDGNFKGAPFIDPNSLVCLKLHSSTSSDIWSQFVCNNDTNYIEFSNLERLYLCCDRSVLNVSSNTNSWHLKFPKLTHLKINSDMIANREFQLMSLNLKTLDYMGSSESAVELFDNDIGCLERLHMDLTVFTEDNLHFKRYVSQTNTIFSKVGPIPEVSFTSLHIHSFCLSRIYWPNLTRLELITSIEPCYFLRSIDRIPQILHLHLIITCLPIKHNDIYESGNDTSDSSEESSNSQEESSDSSEESSDSSEESSDSSEESSDSSEESSDSSEESSDSSEESSYSSEESSDSQEESSDSQEESSDSIKKHYVGNRNLKLGLCPDVELSRLSDLKNYEQSRSKLATLTIDWFTYDAYMWYAENTVLQLNIDKDPGLKMFFERQLKSLARSLHNSGFNYDSTDHPNDNLMRSFDRLNREELMEDAEADIALRAHFPNLVATRFAKMTRD